MVTALVAFLCPAALAQATMSGTVEKYSSSERILVLKTSSGALKNFKLRGDAKCEWMGRNCAPGSYRQGSKVAVRIKGALNDDPIMVDLVTDWGSSKKYVATAARAPYRTVKGDYAMAGQRVGGVPESSPLRKQQIANQINHQAVGVMAHGGSILNPNDLMNTQMSGNMMPMPGNAMGMPGAVMPGMMPGMMPDAGMGMPGAGMPDAGMPGMMPGMGTPGMAPGMPAAPMSPGGTSFGGQQVTLQGIVIQGNPAARTITIKPNNAPMYQQVMIPPNAPVAMQAFQPGAVVTVTGLQTPQGIQAIAVAAGQ